MILPPALAIVLAVPSPVLWTWGHILPDDVVVEGSIDGALAKYLSKKERALSIAILSSFYIARGRVAVATRTTRNHVLNHSLESKQVPQPLCLRGEEREETYREDTTIGRYMLFFFD